MLKITQISISKFLCFFLLFFLWVYSCKRTNSLEKVDSSTKDTKVNLKISEFYSKSLKEVIGIDKQKSYKIPIVLKSNLSLDRNTISIYPADSFGNKIDTYFSQINIKNHSAQDTIIYLEINPILISSHSKFDYIKVELKSYEGSEIIDTSTRKLLNRETEMLWKKIYKDSTIVYIKPKILDVELKWNNDEKNIPINKYCGLTVDINFEKDWDTKNNFILKLNSLDKELELIEDSFEVKSISDKTFSTKFIINSKEKTTKEYCIQILTKYLQINKEETFKIKCIKLSQPEEKFYKK